MTDVLVVGAGPTGLATALLCLRAGLSVQVIDRAPGPSRFSKAIGLQYRVSEILAYLGLADRFLSAGTATARVTMYARSRVLLSLSFFDFSNLSGRCAFVPVGIMIPQSETERLLGEALNDLGVQVQWGTELEWLVQNSSGVSVILCGPDGGRQEAKSDWVIGCDGAHSTIRNVLGLGFEGKSLPLSFVIADVDSKWPRDRDSVHVWFHPAGSAAAMPMPGQKRWRLFIETTRQREPAKLGLEQIRQALSERTGLPDVDVGECLWQSEFRINCRMVDRLMVGRVFLAGDAAHIHSPTGGQGIATGLQDAANLAWKLGQVKRGCPLQLLDTYASERLPEVRRILDETERNTKLFIAPTRALQLLRDWVVLPLLRTTAVQRLLVRRLSQLDVSYRASALSQHVDDERMWWRKTKLQAGDRAPDIVFESEQGGQISLFSLLRDGRPIAFIGSASGREDRLLALAAAVQNLGLFTYAIRSGARDDGIWPCPVLRDRHGDMARLYGMTGEFICIVRSDGHLGLFQRPVRIEPIRGWLMRLYPPRSVAEAFATLGEG